MLHISADIVPVHDRGVDEQFRSHRISPTGHPQGYIPRIRMNTTTPAVSWRTDLSITWDSGTDLSSLRSSGTDLSSLRSSGTDLSITWDSETDLSSLRSSGSDLSSLRCSETDLSSLRSSGTDLSITWDSETDLSSLRSSGTDLSSLRSSGTDPAGWRANFCQFLGQFMVTWLGQFQNVVQVNVKESSSRLRSVPDVAPK